MSDPFAFYLPEDAGNTIVDSALASVRFLRRVSERDAGGHLSCRSIDATPDGELVRYRGRLMDGVGYCADSIHGARQLVRLGRSLERPELEAMGWSYLDHALAEGFFDDPDLPLRMYRDVETGAWLNNVEAHPAYLELGHMARVGTQLARLAQLDPDAERSARCSGTAEQVAAWVLGTERCANGWFPRRCTPDGRVFPFATNAFGPVDLVDVDVPDPIADRSGAGTLALELLGTVTELGIMDAREPLRAAASAFVDAGGCFGSTNTDTDDPEENVSFALGFLALLQASEVLGDPALRAFAYDRCLAPLARFELTRDLNGVATKGLLYMEDSWNAACTWEMAAAAEAYLVAYDDTRHRAHTLKALTILRGLAMHHHGEHGFLTEAVDWDGHSTAQRHFPGERYGDIVTTHPFLNNLQLLEPTATYLERHARRVKGEDGDALHDLEGNRLCAVPLPPEAWMA